MFPLSPSLSNNPHPNPCRNYIINVYFCIRSDSFMLNITDSLTSQLEVCIIEIGNYVSYSFYYVKIDMHR